MFLCSVKNGLKNYGLYTEHMLNFNYLLSKYFDVVNQTLAEILCYSVGTFEFIMAIGYCPSYYELFLDKGHII